MTTMVTETTSLGDVLDITSGFAFKSEYFNDAKGGLPLIRCRDVNTGPAGVYYSGEYEPKYVVKRGELLVSMDGDFRVVRWQHDDALLNQRVCRLEPDVEKLNPDYLFYFLPKELDRIHGKTSFATVKHLSAKSIREINIPLPPLSEQKRIADILDKADAIRRKRQETLDLSHGILPSLFTDFFGTGGKKYSLQPLDGHLDFITSGSRGWAKYYVPNGKRFIRSLDVQMNRLSSDDPAFVDPPSGTEAERTRVIDGDVLVTITGSRVGRIAFIPNGFGEAYVSQHVAIARLKPTLRPRFCSLFLSLPGGGQKQIKKAQYGQTKPGLSLTNIREFQIPQVPLKQQDRFLDICSKFDEQTKRCDQAMTTSENLFDSLVQGAFRGELS